MSNGKRSTVANNKYKAKTYKRFTLQVRKDTEQDIIDFLEAQESAPATIKTAIRKLMDEE